jgi:hypothetical protein
MSDQQPDAIEVLEHDDREVERRHPSPRAPLRHASRQTIGGIEAGDRRPAGVTGASTQS